ncbi:MAG: TMEM165/GDT1 family protein [Alphaproteobacteria bacterium]|nr:TMEM165/GDT1 family protein [Alphaproteobacteria bacterium]MBU6473728.1 TMEM165/GDT1 family protein [Alphaproteobacteria bacterium]MDE2073669.1 TMEM165/GDT1 family protein [Alphaproteobacteria bacterium]MDE2352927.1 TMEM165/GDT1 family protein [Alphaproteobacteria bacterium]
MEAILISALLVAIAEIGDKTQLLAIVLTVRFRRPVPIILGIFCATVANHLMAAAGGFFISDVLRGPWFQIGVSLTFIVMAAWTLVPDKMDEETSAEPRSGAFLTTLIAFFFVEIGDKTQIATVALAARFHSIVLVATGTTVGMLLADVPAVLLAEKATEIVPLKTVRLAAAAMFLGLGGWGLATAAGWLR